MYTTFKSGVTGGGGGWLNKRIILEVVMNLDFRNGKRQRDSLLSKGSLVADDDDDDDAPLSAAMLFWDDLRDELLGGSSEILFP